MLATVAPVTVARTLMITREADGETAAYLRQSRSQ
jgi:hypothetical protein